MVLGGIVAAGLGYGAAYYLGQDDSFETETRAALADLLDGPRVEA